MNELQIINQDGKLLVDSRQVAEMVDRPHYDIMKTIRQYCDFRNQGNFPCVDFFTESIYTDGKRETRY